MAITGIGIAFDVVVGGKALYKLAKGKRCSESERLSQAIVKAKEHKELINSYLYLLEHDAKELLQQAIDSTKSTRQHITEQGQIIRELKQADVKKQEEIERLRQADDVKQKKLEELSQADDLKRQQIEFLMDAVEKLKSK